MDKNRTNNVMEAGRRLLNDLIGYPHPNYWFFFVEIAIFISCGEKRLQLDITMLP
jgi:hypothetical protein